MWNFLFFRVCLLSGFLFAAWKWGDWKNWEKYYPSILFAACVNLFATVLTYHHSLWNYRPDVLVSTQTVIELINCFLILPSTAFIYLSNFPTTNKIHQYTYMLLWVFIYAGLEYIDHYIINGIYYTNGWSWLASAIFDIIMFYIIRIHHLRPLWAWLITLLFTGIILTIFNFWSAEMK